MSLHLVELPIDLRRLHLWAGQRELAGVFDEGVALHHLLGEVFGPAALQPFRLMVAPRARRGKLYAYAAHDAAGLCNAAAVSLTPAHAEVIDLAQVRSLPRPTTFWKAGQVVGFDLRMRPVVRLASALAGQTVDGAQASFRKGAEIDAFLAAALRKGAASRSVVYLSWLAARLAPAAELLPGRTRLAGFGRSTIGRNGRLLEGPDATVHGTLRILDPAAFAALLARGVGRHRAYGYGMLLLRPAQRGATC
jgi:CRISPR system Cascade subunit CasE